MGYQKAQIVRALRGRDSGCLFCVMDVEEGGWLLLADGKRRRVDRPKRKRGGGLEPPGDGKGPDRSAGPGQRAPGGPGGLSGGNGGMTLWQRTI